MSHLQLFWAGSTRATSAGYRDAPPRPSALEDAIEQFLRARGDVDATGLAYRLAVLVQGATEPAIVRGAPRELRRAIEECLQALLCGFEGRPVRVAWASGDA